VNLHNIALLGLDGVVNGSQYGLLGLSFALVFGVTGRFHYAFGIVYTLTAYVATLADGLVPWPAAMLAGLLAAAAAGIGIERFVYRPVAVRGAEFGLLTVFVASFGVSIVGENLLTLVFGSQSRTLNGPAVTTLHAAGLYLTTLEIAAALIASVLALLVSVGLRVSRWGRVVRAVRSNPDLAEAFGIPTASVFLGVFALASALAGVAALVFGLRFAVSPDMGNSAVLYAFIVGFLGGMARDPLRAFAAGVILGVIESLSGLWLPAQWSTLVVFGLLFIFLAGKALDWRPVRPKSLLAAFRG
jgi:branched-subunit amino acid ABC-type transport system permease component